MGGGERVGAGRAWSVGKTKDRGVGKLLIRKVDEGFAGLRNDIFEVKPTGRCTKLADCESAKLSAERYRITPDF